MQSSEEQLRKTQEAFIAELTRESDRGCAIVGAAYLDDLLGQLLREYLADSSPSSKTLFDPSAPLGNFGSRIDAAFVIGLADKSQRDELKMISKVRNRFAHNLDLTFNDPKVAGWCNRLRFAQSDWLPRDIFQGSVAFLAGQFQQNAYWIKSLGISGNFSKNLEKALDET